MSIKKGDKTLQRKKVYVNEKDSITEVTIYPGVNKIKKFAFDGCTNLTSITIPNSVTSISRWAFKGCTSLTSIYIPDNVTYIGLGAFYECTSLTSITIPDGVTWIGEDTFSGCTSLVSITIPNNVTWIGEYAFRGCTSLASINIPDGVTSIEKSAFYGCSNLRSITIPNSVTSIGIDTFAACTNLTSITIPNSVTNIRGGAFLGCARLTSITIPNNVISIKLYTFQNCKSLTSITIPDSVTSIEDSAFAGCSSLNHVIIPDSLNNQNTNYWADKGIDLNKTQLVTRTQLSKWAKGCNLKGNYSSEELSTLYQLQKDDHYRPSWSELGRKSRNIIIRDLLTILPKDKKNVVLPQTLIGQHDSREAQLIHTLSLLSQAPAESLNQENENNEYNTLSLGESLGNTLTLADTAKLLLLSVEKPKKVENTPSSYTDEVSVPPLTRRPLDSIKHRTKNPRRQ